MCMGGENHAMATTLVCGKCGEIIAYIKGDARRLAVALNDVRLKCRKCTEDSRAKRLCKCGHPLPYHTTTGEVGGCVWKDWPRDGPPRDEPIPCGCKKYVEADPI